MRIEVSRKQNILRFTDDGRDRLQRRHDGQRATRHRFEHAVRCAVRIILQSPRSAKIQAETDGIETRRQPAVLLGRLQPSGDDFARSIYGRAAAFCGSKGARILVVRAPDVHDSFRTNVTENRLLWIIIRGQLADAYRVCLERL